MKRQPIYAKEGYIFQHKERTDEFASILWLGEGVSLDDYKEIAEVEYQEILKAKANTLTVEGGE